MMPLMFGEVFYGAVNHLNWGCVGGLWMVGLLWCTGTIKFCFWRGIRGVSLQK